MGLKPQSATGSAQCFSQNGPRVGMAIGRLSKWYDRAFKLHCVPSWRPPVWWNADPGLLGPFEGSLGVGGCAVRPLEDASMEESVEVVPFWMLP